MEHLLVVFFIRMFANIIIIRFFPLQALYDCCEGVQKCHGNPVPRVGGLAIYLAALGAALTFLVVRKSFAKSFLWVFLCALPLFGSGLLEDITKRVGPKWRLIAGFISSSLAFL